MTKLFEDNEKQFVEIFDKWKAKCEDDSYQAKGNCYIICR